MEIQKTQYGFSDDELKTLPTVYRAGLFAGKTVVVSGAGSGLGKAIACLFARLGANVAICGRNEEKLAAATAFLQGTSANIFSRPMTIRDPEQVDKFVEAVWEHFGALDVLVNNAGGQFPQLALDFKTKGWNAVIDTNLNGTWYMMQSAARRWVERKAPGTIVNIVADFWRGMPGMAHTCAARAGVTYLSKSVAVEWAPHRIRVNCVAPGVHETSGFVHYPPEGLKTYLESNPMLRVGDAHDIAEAVAYLSAPSAKFITGEVLTVDGGQQMWGDCWPPGRPEYFQAKPV